MMTKFIFIASAFFLFELVVHGIVPIFKTNDDFDAFSTIGH